MSWSQFDGILSNIAIKEAHESMKSPSVVCGYPKFLFDMDYRVCVVAHFSSRKQKLVQGLKI